MSNFRYYFGPFLVTSELVLPELAELPQAGPEIPVTLRVGTVPPAHMGEVLPDQEYLGSKDAYWLTIEGIGKFYASNGREIIVEPAPGAGEREVRLYLLGSVMGALCHQAGILPLHASSIAHQGRVTAFLADSGVGKSTLAAFLAERGHRVVSDDLCLLDLPSGDPTHILPIAGWLKLWRESWNQIGKSPDEMHRVYVSDDKYRLYLDPRPNEPLKLTNVVFLERTEDTSDNRIVLEPLRPAAALSKMGDTVYMNRYMTASGQLPELVARCSSVLGKVKAFRLVAPRTWDSMPAVVEAVEKLLGC